MAKQFITIIANTYIAEPEAWHHSGRDQAAKSHMVRLSATKRWAALRQEAPLLKHDGMRDKTTKSDLRHVSRNPSDALLASTEE